MWSSQKKPFKSHTLGENGPGEYYITPGNMSFQHASRLDLKTLADRASTTKARSLFQGSTIRTKKAAFLRFHRKRLWYSFKSCPRRLEQGGRGKNFPRSRSKESIYMLYAWFKSPLSLRRERENKLNYSIRSS